MRRIVLVLGALLGFAALCQFSKAAARPTASPRTFPFPTTTSHAAIDEFDEDDYGRWAAALQCDERTLRIAVANVGTSIERIKEYLLEQDRGA